MKLIIYISIILSLCGVQSVMAHELEFIDNKPTIEEHIDQLSLEIQRIASSYNKERKIISLNITKANKGLVKSITTDQKLYWLLEKDKLKQQQQQLRLSELSDISKVRYIKGLEIIKILYEKTLALDHHFASVTTFNEINAMANPNTYPEFEGIKEMMGTKNNKKKGFNLTSILGDNIYASVAHSLITLFNAEDSSKDQKEDRLREIECVLDFTLRMHNDLNTIYFETAFLQKSNESIISNLQQLFLDYTKPIEYKVPLQTCRDSDDWYTVHDQLENYLSALNIALNDESQQYKAHKMQVNLDFPIDQLLQFITTYNSFIDQGGKFYEKFGIMLNSYEHEQQCSSKLPIEYKKLQENINIAISKFNTAYKPVEINGSKMKEVLYGLNEYD